jgi:hypothetical protein
MSRYKFARRSFLQLIGVAAAGLHTMLRNSEAAAQGMVSPSRLLVIHHPVGTVRTGWLPTGSGTNFTFSEILKPFETAMLKSNMVIIDGLDMDSIPGPGGGHEKGTVIMATGAPTKWTRTGQTETDDAMAAGPSIDQLLLSKSTKLQGTAFKSLQALCDDRIDHQEISCRCITYDVAQRPQPGIPGPGVSGASYENTPMRPTLRPLELYTRVFGTMMPGGPTNALTMARAQKKSVLDFSLRELTRLRTLAPASQKAVLDAHEQAIRDLEKELDGQLDPVACGIAMPPPDIGAVPDDGLDHPETTQVTTADDTLHQQIGEYHQAIIRAAFKCDMTRTATFQWSPGTNHIAFKGLHPANLSGIYTHHPVSHNADVGSGMDAPAASRNADVQFLVNVEKWYATRMSEFLNTLKATTDVYGNPLLDNTLIPYLSEISRATHEHNPMPVVLFGGAKLGLKGGQFLSFTGRPYVDLLITIAQAFGVTLADLAGQPMLNSPHTVALPGVLG